MRVPLAVQIVLALGLLLALNRLAPGVPQAILVLVGLYLVLTNAVEVGDLLAGTLGRFDRTLSRPRAGGPE